MQQALRPHPISPQESERLVDIKNREVRSIPLATLFLMLITVLAFVFLAVPVDSDADYWEERESPEITFDSLTGYLTVYSMGSVMAEDWTKYADTLWAEAGISATQITKVNIQYGVLNIGAHAFDGCSNLTTVYISSSVRGDGTSTHPAIGDYAFKGCTSLANVYFYHPNEPKTTGSYPWVLASNALAGIDEPSVTVSVCPTWSTYSFPEGFTKKTDSYTQYAYSGQQSPPAIYFHRSTDFKEIHFIGEGSVDTAYNASQISSLGFNTNSATVTTVYDYLIEEGISKLELRYHAEMNNILYGASASNIGYFLDEYPTSFTYPVSAVLSNLSFTSTSMINTTAYDADYRTTADSRVQLKDGLLTYTSDNKVYIANVQPGLGIMDLTGYDYINTYVMRNTDGTDVVADSNLTFVSNTGAKAVHISIKGDATYTNNGFSVDDLFVQGKLVHYGNDNFGTYINKTLVCDSIGHNGSEITHNTYPSITQIGNVNQQGYVFINSNSISRDNYLVTSDTYTYTHVSYDGTRTLTPNSAKADIYLMGNTFKIDSPGSQYWLPDCWYVAETSMIDDVTYYVCSGSTKATASERTDRTSIHVYYFDPTKDGCLLSPSSGSGSSSDGSGFRYYAYPIYDEDDEAYYTHLWIIQTNNEGSGALSDASPWWKSDVTYPNDYPIEALRGAKIFKDSSGNNLVRSVSISRDVTSIGANSFSGMTNLQFAGLPLGLQTIGDSAFEGCTSLQTPTWPSCLTTIGASAFKGCTSIGDIYMKSPNITTIGASAFENCSSVGSLNLSDSVRTIGASAFKGTGLTSIWWTEPGTEHVVTVGDNAFLTGASSVELRIYTAFSVKDTYTWWDSALGAQAYTYNLIDSNRKCGLLAQYTYDPETKTLSIVGSGTMYDYTAASKRPYETYVGNATSIVISSGITSVGAYAFNSFPNVTTVTVADSVTDIKYAAFKGCSAIKTLTVPICVNLAAGDLGDPAEDGTLSFNGVTNINSITFTAGTQSPYSYSSDSGFTNYYQKTPMYLSRSSLSIVSLPTGIETVPSAILKDCVGMLSITIPSTVTVIGGHAFAGCSSLASITIPDSVTTIQHSAFLDCSGLQTLSLGSSVNTIEGSVFCGCTGLTQVTLPSSITSVGTYAFNGCSSLENVTATVGEDGTSWSSDAFTSTALKFVQLSGEGTFSQSGAISGEDWVSASQTTPGAFPASLTSSALETYHISSLKDIGVVTGKLFAYVSGGTVTVIGSGAMLSFTAISERIAEDPWVRADVTSLVINEGATSIGDECFKGSSITGLELPSSVTTIGNSAFEGSTSLVYAEIPSVTSIGNEAFSGCTSMDWIRVNYNATAGTDCFEGCTGTILYATGTSGSSVLSPTLATEAEDIAVIMLNNIEDRFFRSGSIACVVDTLFSSDATTLATSIAQGKVYSKIELSQVESDDNKYTAAATSTFIIS